MIQDITVVIPVYNRANIVGRTLDSLAAQTWRPLSVVLVDNNSKDGSLEVLEAWRDRVNADDFRVRVISEPTPGAPAARNAGLALVDTEWTMFFDSDDTMHPQHIATAMQLAQSDPEASIIGWDISLQLPDKTKIVAPFTTRHPLYNCIMHGNLSTLRYMSRTCLFRMAGGWNTNLKLWDDIELGVRMLKLPGMKLIKRPGRAMVRIYYSPGSITGNKYSDSGDSSERTLDVIDENLPIKLKLVTNLKRVILAANYRREGAGKQARDLLRSTYNDTMSVWQKMLLRIAYTYTVMGMRGIARILEPFVAGDERI